jgi:hypothetical protein
METTDKEKFAITLLEMINKKREEIKSLTSKIIELEEDPKNVVKIKQNVQSILNAVASYSNSKSNDLKIVTLSAELVFRMMKVCEDRNHIIDRSWWHGLVINELEDFCISANAWNPIEFDFSKKGLKLDIKNVNIGININK